MPRRPSTTTADKEECVMGVKEFSDAIRTLQLQLNARNENTTDAAIVDLQHIRSVISAKWANTEIPMVIRNKWRDIANMVSSVASELDKVRELEQLTTSPCYIIDANGKLRKATCTEIFSALDTAPNESV